MHLFCHNCGTKYSELTWPRNCNNCKNSCWKNPIPVVVMIVPIKKLYKSNPPTHVIDSVLSVRRGIEPDVGKLAMPSGYVDDMEDWRDAAIRELDEEVGLTFKQSDLSLFDILQSKNKKHMLIFCNLPPIYMPDQIHNNEVQELVDTKPEDLVWDTHIKMAKRYLYRYRYRNYGT